MRKQLLSALAAIAVVTAMASTASASACQGLSCPGVLPDNSAAQNVLLPTVPNAEALANIRTSGYYAYNTPGSDGQRAVAYVVAPGEWATAPAEVKQLPLADDLIPVERASKWMVIFGPDAMMSGPWAPQPTAAAARKTKHHGATAYAAAASDCVSPWFCVFTDGSFGGNKCQWQSTSVWQSLGSCNQLASSMVNRRSAWSLLKRNDGSNYCAVPGTQDASLSSNGFNDNTYETYNSTSTSKLSAWNCAN
ncbi:MAG TPA: peptidase inhibitor family I36 protein [Baekduia sp.]|uniref:peptidase inhibitor family I36 protein n=1 Tax=Baekduia sp. TaxID=2600305 RepID=UPI002B99DBB5|nr:peptidase inhibitor family I36 protein [Baekduia sp.]HMJ32930.1 peptidase inhibitor family I36 protein [Baekduia sp.]